MKLSCSLALVVKTFNVRVCPCFRQSTGQTFIRCTLSIHVESAG